jgi:hypothetical protein
MKNYIIREMNFFYDDYYSYNAQYSQTRVCSKHEDYEKAKEELEYLEIQKMKGRGFEPSLFFHFHDFYKTKEALTAYFKDEFKIEITDWNDYNDINRVPKYADKNQILAIKEILNVDFFKILEFEDEIIFYKPIMNNLFWGKEFNNLDRVPNNVFESEDTNGHAFFNSKEDALINIPKMIYHWFHYYPREIKGLYGTIEELSERPDELRIFLESSESVKYNELQQRIVLESYGGKNEITELVKMIDLLVEKPYNLLPISYEDARKCSYYYRYDHIGPDGDFKHYYTDEQWNMDNN